MPTRDCSLFYTLTENEKARLSNALHSIPYDKSGGNHYISLLRSAMCVFLPNRIKDALEEQRASLRPNPYLIIKNLPTDDTVFTTPKRPIHTPSSKSGTLSENVLIGISLLIGEPYSMIFEGEDIVNNLIPIPESKYDYTGLGSEIELDFHIENAALKFFENGNLSPLGLLLTGVREDPSSPRTRLSDSRNALNSMDGEDLDVLRAPLYKIKFPYRWRQLVPDNYSETEPVPLLRGPIHLPDISVVFYSDMVEPISKRASEAMNTFYKKIKEHSFGIDVTPGTVVYIDNRFTLHSRDRFRPTLDENGNPLRWIQRVFVAKSLWHHRQLEAVHSRIFTITRKAS